MMYDIPGILCVLDPNEVIFTMTKNDQKINITYESSLTYCYLTKQNHVTFQHNKQPQYLTF